VRQLAKQSEKPTSHALYGDWKLLYTSEKSVHGLVKVAATLHIAVDDIGQMIDARSAFWADADGNT
jgi:hypothetical protein